MRRWNFTNCSLSLLFLLSTVASGAEPGRVESAEPSTPIQAPAQTTDTIRLKNGSILHGVVVRFENAIFTIIIPGTQSRAMVHVNDVERIDFAESQSTSTSQTDQAVPPVQRDDTAAASSPSRKTGSPTVRDEAKRDEVKAAPASASNQESAPPPVQKDAVKRTETKPSSTSPTKQEVAQAQRGPDTSPPSDLTEKPRTLPVTDPSKQPEIRKTAASDGTSTTTGSPAVKKPASPVPTFREANVSVSGREVWIDCGVEVKKGDRLRISAGGKVNLSRNQSTGPEGVNISDPQRMMPNRPTGGLIAVIGDDNDDFIFIGAAAEFVAARSGRLFLMVNENNLEDNSGAFTVRIQVQSPAEP
jgi:hypothetical protein